MFIQIHHPGYCIAAGSKLQGEISVSPGPNKLEIELDPILLSLGIVVDDRVLAWAVGPPAGAMKDQTVWEQTRWIGPWWSERSETSVLCLAGVPRWLGDRYADVADQVTFKLLTESYGACSVSVPVRHAARWSAPDHIFAGKGRTKVPSSEVRIVLKGPDAEVYDHLNGISMRPKDGREMLWIPLGVLGGEPLRVPNGDYQLVTHRPFLQPHVNGRNISITGDRQVEIDIPMALRPCRIEWRGTGGIEADDGTVTMTWRGQEHPRVFSHGLSTFVWMLPVGTIRIEMRSAAGGFQGNVEIPAGTDPHSMLLELAH